MKLRDIVVENAILTDLQATGRDEAIGELIDALVAAGKIAPDQRDEFVASIIRRENRGSTGFGHGVAVPHIKRDDVEQMAVGIGVSRGGVEFNALDGEPVHSVFMLLSPEDRPEEHLEAMNAIFGNLQQRTFRSFLLQAGEPSDVLMLLEEADARTATP